MMKKIIEESEIKDILKQTEFHNDWTFVGGFLHAEYQFKNFKEAWQFMTEIALEAEKKDHHPSWNNVYSKVVIDLNTHSAGGITELDLELAITISFIFDTGRYKELKIFKD